MLNIANRGKVFQLEGYYSGHRVRISLKTKSRQVALLLSHRIEQALAQGGKSDLWVELSNQLPERSFSRLASLGGYSPAAGSDTLTWKELVSAFETDSHQRIARGKFKESTLRRYLVTLRAFGEFLTEQQVVNLDEINRPLVEKFKAWRFEKMTSKKNSRGGGSLDLDLATLHRIFSFAVEREIVNKNPVKLEGNPGARPMRGAVPFTGEELAKLREHARADWLTFLLLRHTGMRGGDAVGLTWGEVDLKGRLIRRKTQKRGKMVVIPLHPELASALERENATRKPQPLETVLVSPLTNKAMTRPRMYYRMKSLGRRAGIENAHPHRFRDTLAVDMFLRGSSAFDVAKLLGDTIATVETHYAEYVPELQERVRKILESPGGLEDLATFWPQSGDGQDRVH